MYNRLDTIPVCNRQMDRQTSCDGIVRAMHTRRAVITHHFRLHRILRRQLVKSKCIPILRYGLKVCELNMSKITSLDFTINRFFMTLFSTSNIGTVKYCQEFFGFELPSTLLSKRIAKFESMYHNPRLVTVLIMNSFTLLPCRKLI